MPVPWESTRGFLIKKRHTCNIDVEAQDSPYYAPVLGCCSFCSGNTQYCNCKVAFIVIEFAVVKFAFAVIELAEVKFTFEVVEFAVADINNCVYIWIWSS